MEKIFAGLLKYAEEHPDQIIVIIQQILDILKANPELMPLVIAAIKK